MPSKFCPQCGTALTTKWESGRERPACSACGFVVYRNPVPVALVLVIQDDKLLLLLRRRASGIDGLAAFGTGADLFPVFQGFVAHPRGRHALAAHQHDVRPGDRGFALHDVHINLLRCVVDAAQLVIAEIALVDDASFGRDLAEKRQACAEDCRE